MTTAQTNLFDLPRARLSAWLTEGGLSASHTRRLWTYLYHEYVHCPAAMLELPPRLRQHLAQHANLAPLDSCRQTDSSDGLTSKFVLGLRDGHLIETVMMRFDGRRTACLSSQAGCALACVFCATGQAGFTRDLSAGEIVSQALHVARLLPTMQSATGGSSCGSRRNSPPRLRNIVLMGMGEPLLNYDAVIDALEILHDPGGMAIGAKQITISTVGVVPGIVRLADERRPYSLAVSLHAAEQDERAALVPAARAWPLDALIEACHYYCRKLERKIFFEWTLIAGQNDSDDQARQLASLVAGLPAQINLIPLNPTVGFAGVPGAPAALDRFRSILAAEGIPCSVRQRRGIDVAAGCGQLAAGRAQRGPAARFGRQSTAPPNTQLADGPAQRTDGQTHFPPILHLS